MDHDTLDQLLRRAITERRLITFMLNGCRRIAEPHDYGIRCGVPRLFCFQTGGESSSGAALGWRWAALAKISQLQLLDITFAGPRAVPTGQHIEWDELFASVSPRTAIGGSRANRRAE
jgi:hypothetical protein